MQENAIQPRKVLVTGSAGAVGRYTCERLMARGHHVRGFDLNSSPHAHEVHVGDLADTKAVDDAVRGVDVVVHLGAIPDDEDFLTRLLPSNVAGTYNVFNAARQHKVSRVVAASTIQVVMGLPQFGKETITLAHGTAATNHYALSKIWMEQMGEMYSRVHGLSVVIARICWMPRSAKGVQHMMKSPHGKDFYLSPIDAGRFFACAVEAPDSLRFAVAFAVSRPVSGFQTLDPTPAREALGFEPQHTWPQGTMFPEILNEPQLKPTIS